eukprot:357811-Chlamydomonas_euryale.AAC.14
MVVGWPMSEQSPGPIGHGSGRDGPNGWCRPSCGCGMAHIEAASSKGRPKRQAGTVLEAGHGTHAVGALDNLCPGVTPLLACMGA